MKKIDVHGLSIQGRSHEKNQDHFAIAELNKSMRMHQTNLPIDDRSRVHGDSQGHLFLVADGIGAAPSPARASGTAVDSVVQYFLNEMPWYHLAEGEHEDVTLALEDAMRNSQEELLRERGPGPNAMGTTMTLAFVFWPHLYLAHVGNNRCYLQRDGKVRQLTTDHTLAEFRRTIGSPARGHGSNILWNAVGGDAQAIVTEVQHLTLEPGDVLTLVTSGIDWKSAEQVLATTSAQPAQAEDLCGRLVGSAGQDDHTAIVVRFPRAESTLAALPTGDDPDPLEDARQGPRTPVPPKRAPSPGAARGVLGWGRRWIPRPGVWRRRRASGLGGGAAQVRSGA